MFKILNIHQIRELLNNNKIEEVLTFLSLKKINYLSDNFIFVYGSLKENEYNYDRIRNNFGTASLIKIVDCHVTNTSLYDAGDYPVAIKEPLINGYFKLQGQLMFCNNNSSDAIDRMELQAGYVSSFKVLNIDEKIFENKNYDPILARMYIAGESLLRETKNNCKLVKSGNWSEYLREVISS